MREYEEKKQLAIQFRRKGFSLYEISEKLSIALSTASLWVRNVALDIKAKNRLANRVKEGHLRAEQVRKINAQKRLKNIKRNTLAQFHTFKPDQKILKTICATLYWAEGNKRERYISFTNSDPKMISLFVTLLRRCYKIDESKFRALVHLHEYHNEEEIKAYWSQKSQIPLEQFSKSYLKPHTKKTIREGYKGTVRIRYYDARIATELTLLYNSLLELIDN